MKRFKNILCVINALEKRQWTLQRAAELTESNGAELKVIDVVDNSPGWLGFLGPYRHELEQDRSSHLKKLVASLQLRGTALTAELLHGRPAFEITREVLRHGFDLVMKDARGTSSRKTPLIGSVDMRLLRNCPCPVWLHVPDRSSRHDVILAAIDPLAHDPEHRSMNRAILELASSLATVENAELHVVGAWEAVGESMLAGRVPEDRLLAYVSEHHHAAEQDLSRAVSQIRPRIDRSRVQLRNGEPAAVILDQVDEVQCDLLIMGTVARGIPGLLMGNTAAAVLRQIQCSVMTVKPDTFVSPVRLD